MSKGILYLVPAPLGEGGEHVLPRYLLDIVSRCTHILSERGKTTRAQLKVLLPEMDLRPIVFTDLPKHNPDENLATLLQPALDGKHICLFAEAGCPGIADPGSNIAECAHALGIRIVPLVGPSSLMLALMASGLDGQRFAFRGYLPVQKAALAATLREMVAETMRAGTTFLFIETPYRNAQLWSNLLQYLPDPLRLCLALELTLPGETISTHRVSEWKRMKAPGMDKKPAMFLFGR